ncbi:bifunctional aspartate kinase/homoserine dehydrogenase I [Lutibacter sp.]|uniref:bifunctional aspartate kinase/homoserine dehydrogenase I n=1 Tax=Lutibacter sp. TaxID=1925666 RepID=UPI0025C5A9BA|nr:bifunctional aspartate kinase/homoserine dehydrogenase I [Lutibacter sp.]MCF6181793.1 bifunctional aspartate kinase/homoserine dehydrogenase I [Lutibacter sp.]
MKVLKFGGSSVKNAAAIKQVVSIIKENVAENQIIVVSALGGITDLILEVAQLAQQKNKNYLNLVNQIQQKHFEIVNDLIEKQNQTKILLQLNELFSNLSEVLEGVYKINELTLKTADKIVANGELASSLLLTAILKENKLQASWKNSVELIKTNSTFGNALVNFEKTNNNIKGYFESSKSNITVLPGFVASNKNNEITTLGRGGSDYTAAIAAAALNVEKLEIWTDVNGMFTANPTIVKQAFSIKEMTYKEAMEMSHFGAKVLYPPSVKPVLEKEIPILIKNTFKSKAKGTLISSKSVNKNPIKGISHIENISLLTLEGSGLIGIPGIAQRFFGVLAKKAINISLITQASSEHSICIAINSSDEKMAVKAINKEFQLEINQQNIDNVIVESNTAIIALVGDNMKNHQGISGKMFSTLGNNNVNIRAIAQGASEKNISAVIAQKDIKKALNTLHSTFFEDQIKQLNLFVVGVGNVGGKLLEQIKNQQSFLLNNLKIQVRIIGLTNSKKMIFNEDGIDLETWKSSLNNGESLNLNTFHKHVKKLNYRNSIFIDNTANEIIANLYPDYLKESIAVVTCNKIACSSNYESYLNLKKLSREFNAPFLFETNVGAGLPIIDTLKNLIASGDKVTKIQAVLSGSLNFIFNNFNKDKSFYEVVKQAGIEGYTEPDPRIDLSGVDVMRKILILARESGTKLELEDIKNKSFLPKTSLEANSIIDFMETLKSEANHFNTLQKKAANNNCRLKYVAEFDNGKASVGLKEVDFNHPFYNLDGKDNIVLFYTERYSEQPLIIKGAGAGADVTASGLFADIIRIGNL